MPHFSTARESASTPSSRIPFAIAITAAVLLTLASAATNVLAAIGKHTDIGPKLIAGSVALAVALITAIAIPAALAALRSRQYICAVLALAAFVIGAGCSTTSALGVLGLPRLSATIGAEHDAKDREKLNDERNRARVELGSLAPARPATELNSLIASKLATPGANGCVKVNGPTSASVCAEVANLQSEASRAERIAALNGTINRADEDLTRIGRPTIVNPDAAALSSVLAAVGVDVKADKLSVALMVLAVVILEAGSGLAFACAHALRQPVSIEPQVVVAQPVAEHAVNDCKVSTEAVPPVVAESKIALATSTENVHCTFAAKVSKERTPRTAKRPAVRGPRLSIDVARQRVADALSSLPPSPSVRDVAKASKVPKSTVHVVLAAMAAGHATVNAGMVQ